MGDYDFKTTSFEIKGFGEMYRFLDQLPRSTVSREMTPLLAKAVEPIRDTASSLAPDDVRTANPDLESSIVVSSRQRSGRAKSDRPLGQYDARVFIGPAGNSFAYPQAIFQEFGTVKMAAQPYLRPAWDAQKGNALALLKALFGAHIRKIIAKYGLK